MFITFDGIDGTGKTTQIERLGRWLRRQGYVVTTCRDPGGTPLGERIREILLLSREAPIHRRSELMLYMASRAQLVEEIIRPALDGGHIVVCDRFLLASVAYQGYGGGIAPEDVWEAGRIAVGGVEPALTLLLDMPAEAALARIRREHDRMEQQGLEFMAAVRRGYRLEAERRPEQIVVIDAAQTPDAVESDVRLAVAARMGIRASG